MSEDEDDREGKTLEAELDEFHLESKDTSADDLHVTTEIHPGTYRGRPSADMHRIIRAGGTSSSSSSSSSASSSSAPSSPRRTRMVQPRRTYSMAFVEPSSSTSSTSTSTSTQLVTTTDLSQLSLVNFEHHEHELPDQIPEDVLARILAELDRHITSLATITNLNDLSSQWMQIRNEMYQLSAHYLPQTMDINIEYERLLLTLNRLRLKFTENQLIERQAGVTESEKSRAYINRFARLYNILYNVRTMLFSFAHNQAVANPDKPYEMGHFFDYVNPGYFSFLLFEKLDSDQEFIMYILDVAAQRRFRKQYRNCPPHGETICLYEEIKTPEGHPTHAWHRTTFLEEFVHSLISIETAGRQWYQFTKSRGIMSFLKQFLQFSTDVRLPFLKRQKHIFSFRNGIYDADRQDFFLYDHPLPSTVVAAKYFPQNFDISILNPDLEPHQIPTPPLTKLFENQNIPADAQNVIWALIGRMFHDLNKHERWQVALFNLGEPNTGKSTFTNLLMEMFDFDDRGIMDSDMEKQFGISAFMDSFLTVCNEVSEKFNLTHTKLQSMIDGDNVNVAHKYKPATQFKWTAHVILNANVVPPHWNEFGGNLLRRLVCLLFNHPVHVQTKLDEELQKWIPNIIHKCNSAYRRLALEWNDRSFWNADTPQYFVKNREYLGAIISPVQSFIQMSDYVEVTHNPNDTMKLSVFLAALNQFCRERNYPLKKWTQQLYTPTFRRLGIIQDGNMLHQIKSTQEWLQHPSQQSFSGGAGRGGFGGGGQSMNVPLTEGD